MRVFKSVVHLKKNVSFVVFSHSKSILYILGWEWVGHGGQLFIFSHTNPSTLYPESFKADFQNPRSQVLVNQKPWF